MSLSYQLFRLRRYSAHAGIYNGVATTGSWDGEDHNHFNESGSFVLVLEVVTRENIILNQKAINSRAIQGDFGIRGD